jgi:hypothetical protein
MTNIFVVNMAWCLLYIKLISIAYARTSILDDKEEWKTSAKYCFYVEMWYLQYQLDLWKWFYLRFAY